MAGEDDSLTNRLAHYRVSPRLLDQVAAATRRSPAGLVAEPPPPVRAIVELNLDYPGGVTAAKVAALAMIAELDVPAGRIVADRSRYNLFATLTSGQVDALDAAIDRAAPSPIYKVWPDEALRPLLHRSIRTVKADACLSAFGADGAEIVWAVADSGIDGRHPHFAPHRTTDLPAGLSHRDFSGAPGAAEAPLTDGYGHGTHVAGIIAGETRAGSAGDAGGRDRLVRLAEQRGTDDTMRTIAAPLAVSLRGVAPRAKLMSLKVLDDRGGGYASNLIAALEHLEEVNEYGRRIRVHGVNLSLGYPFDASWFAAGQSPLCAAVNRIARSGVVVVAAAGNDGAAFLQTEGRKGTQRIGVDQSINDPGNAEDAITVGATHAEEPHRFGVSYFSSKGPTADGRAKPDLVAPGERILSCAATGSRMLAAALDAAATAGEQPGTAYYREESGTSMAAPHVSGAAAALLSVRREYIGQADAVKAIFVATCTDLRRKADYQGAGLIDLMRAIQSI